MHDREALYRTIWESYCDRYGMVKLGQQKLAAELGLPYQRLSVIFSEFCKDGKMKKFGHRFQMKDPDKFEWGQKGKPR